jgi:thymidylate synthase (FAD)
VLEHAYFSFIFYGVSRVFTHELVRHRAGVAISQESMRFVRLDNIPFWMPEWAQEDKELQTEAISLMQKMENFQRWMADHFGLDEEGVDFHEKKSKTSFMRRFAPDGVGTSIGWTANVRTLRHVIEQRTAEGAEEEIRLVFDTVATRLKEEYPFFFGDFTRSEDGTWTPEWSKV